MGKAAAYHGVQNMKFAKRADGTYATELLDMPYAKSLDPSALLEASEQHADNRLIFRVPKDDGYEGSIGTTGRDAALEKELGMEIDGAVGTLRVGLTSYTKGALYYEYIERDGDGQASVIKVWMYNLEIGKSNESYTSDTSTAEFGEYAYPFRAYGEKVKNAEGTGTYRDEKGNEKTAFMCICGPKDPGYETFGDSVPEPKVKA